MMMNRLFLLLFSVTASLTASAQLNGNGYYRVLNQASSRYITLQDNRGSIDLTSTKADMMAILTIRGFDKEVNDPASVIYIEKVGSQYNLKAQGTDSKAITGNRYLSLKQNGPTYQAYGTISGMDIYLADGRSLSDPDTLSLVQNGDAAYRNWFIKPVNQNDEQYFGLRPELTAGGQRYTSLFASFPFNFYSSGMKAYIVTKVDGDMAVWQEWQGTVPAGTPVIIAVGADDPSGNRLDIVDQKLTAPSNNVLRGVYFANGNPGESHFNRTPYDPNTMRLLGVTSEGRLGYVKSNVTYLPKNRAYLVVPAGSPDEITLVTQSEYETEKAKDDVVVTANSYSRLYGDPNPSFDYTTSGHELKGTPELTCQATPSSPVGTYDIVVSRGSVTNNQATFVNGTLTVTRAPLTISGGSYTIKQNEPLPQFAASYSGFKAGDDAASLSTLPTLTTDAPADKTPGTYAVNVSGASATNYDISYVAGTLTILEADPITLTADSKSKTYGDENPTLTYVASAAVSGTPELSTTATRYSAVGTYPITIVKGTVDYPNLKLVDGTLTVAKAALTVKARSYTIKQNEPLPAFAVDYAGFVGSDDAQSALTTQPVVTTTAPADKTPGTYAINVSGASAPNYELTYEAGTLTILEADAITVKAVNATMTYGDELPELTYSIEGGILEGVPAITCEATRSSGVGSYVITISKGTLDYPNLHFVDATLTIVPAPLNISVGSYTMKQTDPLPEFKAIYDGFKLDDTEASLTKLPELTTDAPADLTPGEYVVNVSGAESPNYEITYHAGRLVIAEADQIVIMANDASMVYGDEVPSLTYEVVGGTLEGEPVISCEATSQSSVGSYAIHLEEGSITYPNIVLVDAVLTISQAPLVVSVDDYTREQGTPNPEFVLNYEGFRNGDTESVLIEKPVATTDATIDTLPGIYIITISGGLAENYYFEYQNGILNVTMPSSIRSMQLNHPVDVFTLSGRKFRSRVSSLEALPSGIYLIEGRKYIVK